MNHPDMNRTKTMLFLISYLFFSLSNPDFLKAQPNREQLQAGDTISRSTILFDFDWLFHRGGALGAEQVDFDDTQWQRVDLPHDWGIEDLPGTGSPFQPDAIGQVSSGFTTGGTGWYRKTFTLPLGQKGQRVHIQFDGVYMNADVWLNGEHLGNHPYGYTSFWFDITGKVKFGKENVLAVQVKNEGQNSRWYSGSGIYRHVWLKVSGPVHVAPWGTYITTPEANTTSAQVHVNTRLSNETDKATQVALVTRILNPEGVEIAKTQAQKSLQSGTTQAFDQDTTVPSPALWSIDAPALYTAVSEVYAENQLLDRVATKFGIRTIAFDTQQGFLLNGKPVELKGGCVHHDNGPLGARAYDRAEERRVELLKASGFNAIRCAHNPPSPAFLDACDRLGMLVIDEAFDMWRDANNPYDYHLYFDKWWQKDIESMVLRDRNHPGIIMWSIGNEIRNSDQPETAAVAHMLADTVRKLDPTRPVTSAVNSITEQKDPYFAALDIAGYNYARNLYVSDHQRKPDRVIFCSESYPLEAFEYWMEVLQHPWVVGDFVWTAFDYIGEASIGWRGYMQEKNFYPWNLAFCGDIDICGWKRPQSFYRDALWKNGDQVSVFVKPPQPSFPQNPHKESWSIWNWHDVVADWNWPGYENHPLEVEVYASCEAVELFLNGKSLGKKETSQATKFTAKWEVPFQPGALKAVGYRGSKATTSSQLVTAGAPVGVKLSADRSEIQANGQDLSYITVELVDEKGIRNPKAENLLKFEVTGPGTMIAVGNANPVSTESFQQPQRKAWKGRCLVIVKSGKEEGNITLKASADGLQSAEIVIKTHEKQ